MPFGTPCALLIGNRDEKVCGLKTKPINKKGES
jgi:hypothetical protein